jgi:hypothetical protein
LILRLDLCEIDGALLEVERSWPHIDAELQRLHIGRKDPFTTVLRNNMLSAYAFLDELLAKNIEPFSAPCFDYMLTLNDRVHYGTDTALMAEFATAIESNVEKFNAQIETLANWYWRHARQGDHAYKLAAETYVSIVGEPQLFIEGNHRTGSLIASWINLYAGYPPFVLSPENAIDYFAPSAAIKQFANRSTWRGRQQLPKYRKSFRNFWEQHVEKKYVLDTAEAAQPTGTGDA